MEMLKGVRFSKMKGAKSTQLSRVSSSVTCHASEALHLAPS